MSSPEHPIATLEAIQRELWRLIVAPEGVASALRGAGEGPALDAIVCSDAAASAQTRLGVYANAYFERILGCLEADFSTLRKALGEEAFRDLATSYLAVRPPRHFSLRHVGAGLPSFLQEHAAGAPFRDRWPWCADLARFEAAIADVFDAPDSAVARRADLAELAPERWAELELTLIPAHRLLEAGWPVHVLRAAHGAEQASAQAPGALAAATTRLCVWREAERVFHRELDGLEASALSQAAQGARFGDLCELAEQALGSEAATPEGALEGQAAAAEAAGWLARWLDDGLLACASVPELRGGSR